MKKKNLILIVLIIFLCYNCNNKHEKSIIGRWYSLDEKTKLTYTTDSIFVNNLLRKGTWTADKNHIKSNWIYDFQKDSIIRSTYPYKLITQSRLIISSEKDTTKKDFFLRSSNFMSFLFKKNNVNINLEENYNAKFSKIENKYGIKIFIGYKNDSIIIKSEYSENLDNLNSNLKRILKDLSPYFKDDYNSYPNSFKNRVSFDKWIKMNIHYSLFVDKNIPKNVVKSTVKKLKNSRIKKIYQAFKTEESKYIDFNKIKEVEL